MLATVVAITSVIGMGMANFFGPLFTRRTPVLTVILFSQIGGGVALLPVMLAFKPSLPGLDFILVGAAAGVFMAPATVFALRAGQIGPIGLVSVVLALSAIIPVAGGLAVGDQPSAGQWAGILLAAVGTGLTLLMGERGGEHGGSKAPGEQSGVGAIVSVPLGAGAVLPALRPAFTAANRIGHSWLLLACLGAVGFGLFMLALAELSKENAMWATMLTRIFTALGAAVMILFLGRPLFSPGNRRRQLVPLPLLGVLMAGAALLFGFAAKEMQTVASALTAFAPVVTVALSWILLRERLTAAQIAGIMTTVAGLTLVAL